MTNAIERRNVRSPLTPSKSGQSNLAHEKAPATSEASRGHAYTSPQSLHLTRNSSEHSIRSIQEIQARWRIWTASTPSISGSWIATTTASRASASWSAPDDTRSLERVADNRTLDPEDVDAAYQILSRCLLPAGRQPVAWSDYLEMTPPHDDDIAFRAVVREIIDADDFDDDEIDEWEYDDVVIPFLVHA